MEDKIRYNGLDVLRFICAVFVFFIHIKFPNSIQKYIEPIIRTAVPLFFMISGFFYQNLVESGNLKRQILKILKYLIYIYLIFFILAFLEKMIISNIFYIDLDNMFTINSMLKFIIFNECPFFKIDYVSGHLWYMSAIIYTYIFVNIITRYNIKNKYIFLLCVFILYLSLFINLFTYRTFLYRNWLMTGVPYFLIGILIWKNKDFIKKINFNNFIILFIVFLFLSEIEKFLFFKDNFIETYIFTFPFCIIIFIIFFKLNIKNNSILATFGKKYSFIIYIVHPWIIHIINEYLLYYKFEFIIPIIVLLCSIIFAIIFDYIRTKISTY